jgi:hypothetical protein
MQKSDATGSPHDEQVPLPCTRPSATAPSTCAFLTSCLHLPLPPLPVSSGCQHTACHYMHAQATAVQYVASGKLGQNTLVRKQQVLQSEAAFGLFFTSICDCIGICVPMLPLCHPSQPIEHPHATSGSRAAALRAGRIPDPLRTEARTHCREKAYKLVKGYLSVPKR